MPRVLPAYLKKTMANRSGFAPANLVDIQTLSGDIYYWSDFAGIYPVRIGAGPTAAYKPWIKSCGPFKLSRSLAADAGTIIVQNISGALSRDVSAILVAKEFVGALVIYRWWSVLAEYPIWEFHGYVRYPTADEQQATLPIRQLFDLSQRQALDIYTDQCTWRYKSDVCGSNSGLATCDLSFGNCQARGAVERFNGLPFAPPNATQIPASPAQTSDPATGPSNVGGGGNGIQKVSL